MLKRLITITLCALLLCSCGANNTQENAETEPATTQSQLVPTQADSIESISIINNNQNIYGNTSGNLVNFGRTAIQGDWIYYTGDSEGIYKIKTDGTENMRIRKERSMSINVVGDWIYYRGGTNIYKIRADGTENTLVCDDFIDTMYVVGERIYYSCRNDNGRLYKIRTDGTEKVLLNDEGASILSIDSDWIYYKKEGGGIYKIRTDGTGRIKVTDYDCYYTNIIGDWIYFSNTDDGKKLYKIGANGTNAIKINDDECWNLNVAGDWIYYENESDNGYLYKVKTDGTEKIKLNDCKSFEINLAGDWIYYRNSSDSNNFYKMKTDGSENQPVEVPPYEVNYGLFSEHDLKAVDLLNFHVDEYERVIADTEDWEVCPPDVFREYMFGAWEGTDEIWGELENGLFVIDDTEKNSKYNLRCASGYYRKGDVIIFIISSFQVESAFLWLDINEPDKMYMKISYGSHLFTLTETGYDSLGNPYNRIYDLTKTDIPVEAPVNGYMSKLRLYEIMQKYGIDYEMIFNIRRIEFDENENPYHFVMDGYFNTFPIYLISEEPEKLVFKSVVTYFWETYNDVEYVIEKVDGEWVRTVEYDEEAFKEFHVELSEKQD